MRILVGCEMTYEFPQVTPMIATLNVHSSRVSDMERPDYLVTTPTVPVDGYRDTFGNWCNRLVAPAGRFTAEDRDGRPRQRPMGRGRSERGAAVSSRTCHPIACCSCSAAAIARPTSSPTIAWSCSATRRSAGPACRQSAITCTITSPSATSTRAPTRTAAQAFEEKRGVCRDYAHLALAFCRCLNIPARYCTGYISDIGLPPPYAPQDFGAWIEVFLGDRWHTFDPRNNDPRIGRILVARGRDAADVPLTLTFGPSALVRFVVTTEEAGAG